MLLEWRPLSLFDRIFDTGIRIIHTLPGLENGFENNLGLVKNLKNSNFHQVWSLTKLHLIHLADNDTAMNFYCEQYSSYEICSNLVNDNIHAQQHGAILLRSVSGRIIQFVESKAQRHL